jgi:hypothetical protein
MELRDVRVPWRRGPARASHTWVSLIRASCQDWIHKRNHGVRPDDEVSPAIPRSFASSCVIDATSPDEVPERPMFPSKATEPAWALLTACDDHDVKERTGRCAQAKALGSTSARLGHPAGQALRITCS